MCRKSAVGILIKEFVIEYIMIEVTHLLFSAAECVGMKRVREWIHEI